MLVPKLNAGKQVPLDGIHGKDPIIIWLPPDIWLSAPDIWLSALAAWLSATVRCQRLESHTSRKQRTTRRPLIRVSTWIDVVLVMVGALHAHDSPILHGRTTQGAVGACCRGWTCVNLCDTHEV